MVKAGSYGYSDQQYTPRKKGNIGPIRGGKHPIYHIAYKKQYQQQRNTSKNTPFQYKLPIIVKSVIRIVRQQQFPFAIISPFEIRGLIVQVMFFKVSGAEPPKIMIP